MGNILHLLWLDQPRRSLGRSKAREPESRRLSAMCCGKAALPGQRSEMETGTEAFREEFLTGLYSVVDRVHKYCGGPARKGIRCALPVFRRLLFSQGVSDEY